MNRRLNIIDEEFGRWTVLSYAGQNYWKCRCRCGTVKNVSGSTLRRGTSTGCLKCKNGGPRTHGESKTRLYASWRGMIARCENPNEAAYANYGGRGIHVCRAWRRSYETFRAWAISNGYAAHLTIDRKDGSKGYNPQNCRWATYKEQNRNRRDNKPITYEGETVLISVLAERHGLPADAIKNRIRRYGWTIEKALTTPVNKRAKREPWVAAGMSRSSWYRHKQKIDTLPKSEAA